MSGIQRFTSTSLLNCVFVIIAGVVLCFMGFYNNYPLFYSDTITYLLSGFLNEVPLDRPVFYGWIARHVSLSDSLWLVILFQGLVLSLILFYYFKYFLETTNYRNLFLSYIFLITFFTGASVNVSQLIPDIFTPVSILCLGLLVLAPGMKKRDVSITSVFFVVAILTHNSHFIIISGSVLLLTIIYAFRRIRLACPFIRLNRIILVWILLVGTYLFGSTINYSMGSTFALSRGSHVFLINRLNDIGLLKDYLDKNCDKHHYRICSYKDSIPWDFLWDYDHSPLYKTGGWEANREEYLAISRDMLSKTEYLDIFMLRTFESGLQQFFSFDVEDPQKLAEGATTVLVKRYFNEQLKQYLSSRQNRGQLDYSVFNVMQRFLFALSLLLCILLLFSDKIPLLIKALILFVMLTMLINAYTCSALAMVATRFQSRVVWLVTLPVFLAVFKTGFSSWFQDALKISEGSSPE